MGVAFGGVLGFVYPPSGKNQVHVEPYCVAAFLPDLGLTFKPLLIFRLV